MKLIQVILMMTLTLNLACTGQQNTGAQESDKTPASPTPTEPKKNSSSETNQLPKSVCKLNLSCADPVQNMTQRQIEQLHQYLILKFKDVSEENSVTLSHTAAIGYSIYLGLRDLKIISVETANLVTDDSLMALIDAYFDSRQQIKKQINSQEIWRNL